MAAAAQIELRVLGDVEISGAPARLTRLQKLLLGALILRGRSVSVDVLVDMLWRDQTPRNPRSALQVHVSRLRRLLTATSASLDATAGGYALVIPAEHVDVRVFAGLVSAGIAKAEESAEAGLGLLDQALTLWRGHPLGALDAPEALTPDIERLEELRLSAVEARAAAVIALGRSCNDTVVELQHELSRYPLNERVARLLMISFSRLGREGDALETYAKIEGELHRELAVAPGAELDLVREEILHKRREERSDVPNQVLSPGFVGREAELAVLDHALGTAAEGECALVLVTGELGIGKTAVVNEAILRARTRGHTVLIGRSVDSVGARFDALLGVLRSVEGEEALRLAPARRKRVRSLCRRLEAASEEEPKFAELLAEMEALIRDVAAQRPALILFGDLHWAGDMTLDVVDSLARSLTHVPVALLLSARTPVTEKMPGFDRRLFEFSRIPGAQRLALDGLRPTDIAEYLTVLRKAEPTRAVVSRVAHRTRGNPLFIRAIADAVESGAELPAGLRNHFRRLLDALAEPGRNLVRVMAFVRGKADPRVLATVLGVDLARTREALSALVALGILDTDEAQTSFRIHHPLLAETVTFETPGDVTRGIHRDLAWAFSTQNIPDLVGSHAAAAYHWTKTGDHARGLREYLLATEEAAALSQNTRALSYLENAIELCLPNAELGAVAETSLAEMHGRAAELAMRIGRSTQAIEHARAAITDEFADPVELGQRWLTLAETLRYGEDVSREAQDAVSRALELIPDAISEARVRALLGQVANWSADPDSAATIGDSAIELAELVGSPSLLARAFVIAGSAEMVRGQTLGASIVLHGRSIAEQSGDLAGVLTASASLAEAHILCGRPDDGANVALVALDRIVLRREEEAAYLALAQQAVTGLTLAGRWQEAASIPANFTGEGMLQDALAGAEAHLWALKGDRARAKRALQRRQNPRTSLAECWLSFSRGQTTQLYRAASRVLKDPPPRSAAAHNETVFLTIAGKVATLRDAQTAPSAREEIESLLSLLRPDPGGMPTASAWSLLARAEAGVVLAGSAERGWRTARDVWGELSGWLHVRAYIECRLAKVLGHSEEAATLLVSAMSTARQLGSTTLQKLALAVAVRIDIALDTFGHADVREFTPREREVLDHIADGASNSKIAAALGVSEKTVSVHVSSLLRKVGIESRTELALWSLQMV